MQNNGKIITKQFISYWNSKRLRGSVGRAHIHIGYIILKSNEEILVRNPKSKIFFFLLLLYIVCCLVSSLWCITVSLSLSHWYPGSGVVLDCIDS